MCALGVFIPAISPTFGNTSSCSEHCLHVTSRMFADRPLDLTAVTSHEREYPRSGEDYYCQENRVERVTMYPEHLEMIHLNAQGDVEDGRAFFARF